MRCYIVIIFNKLYFLPTQNISNFLDFIQFFGFYIVIEL